MKWLSMAIVLLATQMVSGCGGSGSDATGGTGTGNPVVQQGLADFADRDIAAAQETFCDALVDDPTEAELAFGCFFAKLLLLAENDDADTLLAAFGESPFDVNTALLDDGGLFDNADLIEINNDLGWPKFNYSDFGLPFADFFTTVHNSISSIGGPLLQLALDSGESTATLKTKTLAFQDDFTDMEEDLEVVLADTSFTLDLPGELFHLDEDVTVSYNDTLLMMAGLQSTIVGLAVMEAYNVGVEIENIVEDDVIDREVLVADLNGSGETVNGVTVDTTVFLTLEDASAITSQHDKFISALGYFVDGLQDWVDGEVSEFFKIDSADFDYAQGVVVGTELIDSMSGMTTIDSLGGSSFDLDLNLDEFFTNPPDAATMDVGAGDPFVMEDGVATPVEAYFQTFLDGIAEF